MTEPEYLTIGDDPKEPTCSMCDCSDDGKDAGDRLIDLGDCLMCIDCFGQLLHDAYEEKDYLDVCDNIQAALTNNDDAGDRLAIVDAIKGAF